MIGIKKYFGDFCALNGIDLDVEKGTIHAILGENGAGKSTLMNILYGLYPKDAGEIFINGEKVDFANPVMSINVGIGMVHQHFMLVDKLTAVQNIVLGDEKTNKLGFLSTQKTTEEIMKISHDFGLHIEPDKKIEDISVGMQQRIEILKVLYRGADILIFDEPTAVLTPQEITEFMGILTSLAESGKSIILITHKLKEIRQVAHKCTVIRRGNIVGTVNVADTTDSQLAAMMVGREVVLQVAKEKANAGDVMLEIEDLVVEDRNGIAKLNNFSAKFRGGEVFGIAGVDGNGQQELVEAITGLRKAKSGKISKGNVSLLNASPATVIENKINTIHEDRQKRGLILDFSVENNLILGNQNKSPFSKKGLLQFDEISNHAAKLIEEFDVRPSGCEKNQARALSGGNQQKLIIAREITDSPDVLIAVQPTRGVDVGAAEFIYNAIIAQRDLGKSIILVSLDLDEIINLSDTIGVLYNGQLVATMPSEEADEFKIGALMAGGVKHD